MWPGLGAAGCRTLGGPRARGGSLVAGSGSRILLGWCHPTGNVSSQWWLTSSRIWVQNTPGVGDKLLAELGSEVWAVGPRDPRAGVRSLVLRGGLPPDTVGYEAVEKLVLACCPRRPLACCGWAV